MSQRTRRPKRSNCNDDAIQGESGIIEDSNRMRECLLRRPNRELEGHGRSQPRKGWFVVMTWKGSNMRKRIDESRSAGRSSDRYVKTRPRTSCCNITKLCLYCVVDVFDIERHREGSRQIRSLERRD